MKEEDWKKQIDHTPSLGSELPLDATKLSHMDIIGVLLEIGNVMEFGTYTGHPTSKSAIFDMLLGSITSIKEVPSFTNPMLLTVIKYIERARCSFTSLGGRQLVLKILLSMSTSVISIS